MAASYPGSVKTFSTKAPGQAIASSHINELQDEVVAVETELKKTTATTSVNAADSAKLGGVNASDLLSGWIPTSGWTINDAASGDVNVSSGALSVYSVGDKVKLTNETVKYFYIVHIEDNHMFLNGGSDYVLSGAYGTALSSISYSHEASPQGFPQWFDYTPTVTATGGTLTTASGSGSYVQIGKLIVLRATIDVTNKGTGTGSLHFSLPIAPSGLSQGVGFDYGGSGKTAMVLVNNSPALIINIDGSTSVFDGASYYVTVAYAIE